MPDKGLKPGFQVLVIIGKVGTSLQVQRMYFVNKTFGHRDMKQESPAVADKPARRLRKVRTAYVRAVGL